MRGRLVRVGVVALIVAAVSIGAGQLLAKKPAPSPCPTPSCGWFCTMEWAPVVCGTDDCLYSNMCVARCAGWAPGQCTQIGGPIPFP